MFLALLAGACAAAPDSDTSAARQGWTRDPAHDPWFRSGVSPTAESIRFALYEDAYQLDQANCPFATRRCAEDNRSVPTDFIAIERVRCRSTSQYGDRCRFTLIERVPGGGRRTRSCKGDFEIVGHSDYPMRWGIVEDEYDRLVLTCRR